MKFISLLLLLSIYYCYASDLQQREEIIRVKNNRSFSIKLRANPSTGYQWILEDSAYRNFLTLDSTFFIPTSTINKIGAPEIQGFQFKAFSKGTCKLHFIYKRVWEKTETSDEQKVYSIIIQ